MKGTIKITLQSDTIIGSGLSNPGYVDTDIVFDERGVPYIPSKRIYGIMRENAELISNYSDQIIKEDITRLFGKVGCTTSSALYIENGYIRAYADLKKFIDHAASSGGKNLIKTVSPSNILDYYTYVRYQTAIEGDIAKEHSLRSTRVLKKGLEFNFICEYPDDQAKKVGLILKTIRSIGSGRTRGFGECECQLIPDGNDNAPVQCAITENNVQIVIESKSPVIIEGAVNETIDYIPASYIHGYLANKMIKQKELREPHKDDEFRELFLKNRLTISNAYPVINNQRSIPLPLSIKMVKGSSEAVDMLFDKSIEQLQNAPFSYIIIDSEDLVGLNVTTSNYFHHKRPKQKNIGHVMKENNENSGAFYQYSAIEPNQLFAFEISGEKNKISALVNLMGKEMNIGKSKKVQYGSMVIKDINQHANKSNKTQFESSKELLMTFISDCIIPPGYDIEKYVTEQFANNYDIDESQISIIDSYLRTSITGGYYGAWGMPKIKYMTIRRGSEIKIRNDSETSMDLSKTSFYAGLFRNEGFGEIRINLRSRAIKSFKKANPAKGGSPSQINKELIEYIVYTNIRSHIKSSIITSYNSKTKSTKSFLSNILNKIQNCNSIDEMQLIFTNCHTKKQKKELEHIRKALFIKSNNDVDYLKFDDYLKKLMLSSDENTSKLLQKLNVNEENIVHTRVDELYKIYATELLKYMLIEKKEVKNGK